MSRVFVEIDPALRRRIESVIEHLIDLCDQLDGFCEEVRSEGDEQPAESFLKTLEGAGRNPNRTY